MTRTHPVVEGLAGYTLETALAGGLDGPGKRCGVVRTDAVSRRTTVILLRMRFHIVNQGRDGQERPLLAEDLALVGFEGSPEKANWIEQDRLEALLQAQADANIGSDQAHGAIERILERFDLILPHLDKVAEERGEALFDAHRRVRKATRSGVRALQVVVHKPADVLGIYVYLPAAAGGES